MMRYKYQMYALLLLLLLLLLPQEHQVNDSSIYINYVKYGDVVNKSLHEEV